MITDEADEAWTLRIAVLIASELLRVNLFV